VRAATGVGAWEGQAPKGGLAGARPGLVRQPAPGEEGVLGIVFTVTKKVGNAATRNRAKRRLRALALELLPDVGLPGWD